LIQIGNIIGGKKRHPKSQNIADCINALENTLQRIISVGITCIFAGDMNNDLLKYETHRLSNN